MLICATTSCSTDTDDLATDADIDVIRRLLERLLVAPCWCDGWDIPHPKITPLGRTALDCAKALEGMSR